jgi:4-hydroxybenzoate polyprenyltransferase
MNMLEALLFLIAFYAAFGLLFALGYVALRLPAPASPGLRLILIPGALCLWPLLLYRWKTSSHDPSPTPRS